VSDCVRKSESRRSRFGASQTRVAPEAHMITQPPSFSAAFFAFASF
jgi:hypothetical protein